MLENNKNKYPTDVKCSLKIFQGKYKRNFWFLLWEQLKETKGRNKNASLNLYVHNFTYLAVLILIWVLLVALSEWWIDGGPVLHCSSKSYLPLVPTEDTQLPVHLRDASMRCIGEKCDAGVNCFHMMSSDFSDPLTIPLKSKAWTFELRVKCFPNYGNGFPWTDPQTFLLASIIFFFSFL